MEGYGKIFHCSRTAYSVYDVTAVSGLPVRTGPAEDLHSLFDRFTIHDNDRVSFHTRGGITRYTMRRLPSLPEICRRSGDAASPEFNFQVFWHTFEEHYAFFGLRGIDWKAEYGKYRPAIDAGTEQRYLRDTLLAMTAPFKDSHIRLTAGDYTPSVPDTHGLVHQWLKEFGTLSIGELYRRGFARLSGVIPEFLEPESRRSGAGGLVHWGTLTPDCGYLAVLAMANLFGGSESAGIAGFETVPPRDLSMFEETFDRALADLASSARLVLDLRFNPGGFDTVALNLAERFITGEKTAFTKKAVCEGGFTAEQTITVNPSKHTRYEKPVALLQSRATASAAEICCLALKGEPHIVSRGEVTRGILSDMLGKRLPNGWLFSLSNEIYEDAGGQCFESRGIPPDIPRRIFTEDDFYTNLAPTTGVLT